MCTLKYKCVYQACTHSALKPKRTGHVKGVTALALSADGCAAFSASRDGSLRVWSLTSGAELHTLALPDGPLASLCAQPCCGLLVCGAAGAFSVWDIRTADAKPQLVSVAGLGAGRGGANNPDKFRRV